ncbi:MAG: hypothetical protein U5K69_07735 [Balneolaceae bacterium]|nr:hypothetical protein [Balneolaceae bacterium]
MHDNYRQHLDKTIQWLLKSNHKKGGSRAHFNPVTGWGNPYPETTGYIIPTLIDYAREYDDQKARKVALNFGEWLLAIQNEKGYWNGGLYPAKKDNPSVFNTGQILFGMIRLYQETGEENGPYQP